MKINPNLEPQGGQGPSGAGAAGAAGVVQASRNLQAGQPDGTDKADFSAEAQQFAMLKNQLSSQPTVRQDRVAGLRTAVQNGTYSVNNQQIAKSMLQDFNATS